MKKKILSEEFISKAYSLKEQGLTRKKIAENLNVSYGIIQRLFGPERLGIDRSKKEPWTIENLQKLEQNYKVLPPRELCLMFNRDRYDIRQLLSHLGWEIPATFFKKNKEETIQKVAELSSKYNMREIASIIGVSFSQVQSICSEHNIQCVKTRNNIAKEQEAKKEIKLTPEQMCNRLLREQADEIKRKLGKTYKG